MEDQAEYTAEQEVSDAMEMLGSGYDAEQQIIDDSDLRKYRIELPNLYDDSDLDPYEFRLLAHYKRVGKCTEGTRTTAKKCHMSAGQASEKRQSLSAKKFINLKEVPIGGGRVSYIVTVIDRWEENFKKYSARSHSERGCSPGESGVHSVKQRSNHIKNKPIKKDRAATPKTADPRTSSPEITLFRSIRGQNPKKHVYDLVISSIQKINIRLGRTATRDDILPFWEEWASHSTWNPDNLAWLKDWAVSGIIPVRPGSSKGNFTPAPQSPAPAERSKSDIAVAEIVKARRAAEQMSAGGGA